GRPRALVLHRHHRRGETAYRRGGIEPGRPPNAVQRRSGVHCSTRNGNASLHYGVRGFWDPRGLQEGSMRYPAIAIPPMAIGLVLLCAPALALDDAGQIAFNNACRTCHTVREGDNRLGPSLSGVIGRKAGSLASYNHYSESMKQAD